MSEASLLKTEPVSDSYTEPAAASGSDEKHAASGYEFPGWGDTTRITDLEPTQPLLQTDAADTTDASEGEAPAAPSRKCGGCACTKKSSDHRLGQWLATSISGNDITSSCLYVSGIAAQIAGPWTPVSLLLVALLLYLFRGIYSEVGRHVSSGFYFFPFLTRLQRTTTEWRHVHAAAQHNE
jgi:hypothetical protein